ncbi:MAG: N-acetylmuramoyl-L-alanine amidase, partial [Treponemataceae bacterium]|nr:N-acetylmuramoyl-L-alanine amidase [Treponemataceae bacterium]
MKKRLCFFAIVVLVAAAFAQNTENLVASAEKTGAQVYWDSLSGTGILEKNGHQLSFRAGDAVVLQDYKTIALTDAPELRDGVLYVSRQFLSLAEKLFAQTQDDAGYHIGAVLIDPGHGGKDPGCVGKKAREKDVVLA